MYGYHSKTEPNTGVIHINSASWIHEEFYDAIDLDLEAFIKDVEERGLDLDKELEWYESQDSTLLIGSWKKDSKGLYEPDKTGEYSAIVRECVIQVVHSKWYSMAHYCSPCYPSQCDLDTAGDYPAFQLPPDMFADNDRHLPIVPISKRSV